MPIVEHEAKVHAQSAEGPTAGREAAPGLHDEQRGGVASEPTRNPGDDNLSPGSTGQSGCSEFYQASTVAHDDNIAVEMKAVLRSISQEVDRRLATLNITDAQWVPLLQLASGRCKTACEIARLGHGNPGAMARTLERIESKGMIKRQRSARDRRVVDVVLTPEGCAVASRIPRVLRDVMNAHLAGITEVEAHVLLGLLMRMRSNGRGLC